MRKPIAGLSSAVVALSLMLQPAFAQRLVVPATGQEGIQLVHSAKPAAKKAGKASKATPKKAKPAATGKAGSPGTAARS